MKTYFIISTTAMWLLVGTLLASSELDDLRVVKMSGVVLHKTSGPLAIGPLGDDFPGRLPAQFIQKSFDISVLETQGGKKILERNSTMCTETSSNEDLESLFGANLLVLARDLFVERKLEDELQAFLDTGVSNPDAGNRRMHWVGITILPNQSLALHAHPNVEFAYIVEGVMHEWRMVNTSSEVEKKRVYAPETLKKDGETRLKYIGPNLTEVDASKTFGHRLYREGEMFINTIGDVHQSYTKEEGVKLFVMWGDGNADVPKDELPQNANFLNKQSAQAWS